VRFGARGRIVAALATVAVGLTGCGKDSHDTPAAGDTSTPTASDPGTDPSTDPSADPSAPSGPTTTCSDGRGDSADPQLDLFDVRLSRTGKSIRVVFDESNPPSGTPLSWVVGFVSPDGKHTVNLTADVKANGDISHGYSVDEDDPVGVDDVVRINAEGMTSTWPSAPVDALGKGVRWYATLGVDGDEIDYCPGGAELREVLDVTPLTLPNTW
jgi:hypothetical protein